MRRVWDGVENHGVAGSGGSFPPAPKPPTAPMAAPNSGNQSSSEENTSLDVCPGENAKIKGNPKIREDPNIRKALEMQQR